MQPINHVNVYLCLSLCLNRVMYPNNQQPPIPQGIDYLNQIAPPPEPEKPKMSTATKVFLVVVGFMALITIGLAASILSSDDTGPTPTKLVARLESLQSISNDYHRKIRTSAIQDANSSLRAVLATANQSIKTPLASYKSNPKEVIPETGEKTRERLDEAYLNYQLDETYVREMGYLIQETIIMMKTIEKETKVASMKTYLEKTITDFENLKKRFDALAGIEAEEESEPAT